MRKDADDRKGILHARLINILNHGNHSLYESREMLEENKRYFRKILNDFLSRYPFNPELFSETNGETPWLITNKDNWAERSGPSRTNYAAS